MRTFDPQPILQRKQNRAKKGKFEKHLNLQSNSL